MQLSTLSSAAALLLPTLGACTGYTPGKDVVDYITCDSTTVVSASSIVSDTTRSGFACRADVTYDSGCEDKVYGVRVTGSGSTPSSLLTAQPSGCGSSTYTDSSPDAGWVSEAGYIAACPDVDNNTSALTCNSAEQAQSGAWQVFLPAPSSGGCSAWGDLSVTFLLPSEDECDPPADTPDPTCTVANDAPATFIHRNAFELDGDDTIHTHILPVVQNAANRYSERTWLRNVTVTDWGDADRLYVLKKGYGIHYDGDDVIEDGSVYVLSPSTPSMDFAEGAVFMGTTFASNSLPIDAETFELPAVTFDWSCGVPAVPHYATLTGLPQAYAIRLNALGITGLTSGQLVKLRMYTGQGLASLELQGRYHDRLTFPMTPSGANWVFDHDDGGTVGVDAAGTISTTAFGAAKVITFSRLIVRGVNLGTPTWTLNRFTE